MTKARRRRYAPPAGPATQQRSNWFTPTNVALTLLALAAVVLTGFWIYQQVRPDPSLEDRLASAATDDTAEIIAALQQGDVAGAHRVFLATVHPLIHEMDFTLRQRDPQLGEAVWNAKLAAEAQFANERDAGVLLTEIQTMQGLLVQARGVMGGG
jgi:hypothetical protein